MVTSGSLVPVAAQLRDWAASGLAMTARAVAALEDEGPDVAAPALDAHKVVGEALLLLRATAGPGGVGRSAVEWQRLLALTAPLSRPETLPTALCLDPGRALETAFCHVQLSALGDSDPRVDRLLDLARAEPACGPEPYVVGALHRVWLHGVHTGRPDHGELDALLARCSLGRPVDVLRGTTQDAYDLTHAVMHGTDLGAWAVRVPRPVPDLLSDLDALLGLALDADNQDLATELLWAWPMLRLPPTPAACLTLSVLDRAHRDHGFLPGPGFDPALHDTLSPDAAEAYRLRTSYHATLVLGILGAALLTAGTNLTDPRPRPGSPTGATARLLAHLGATRNRSWLADPSLAEDDGLAGMVLAAALRRACDRSDLRALHEMLSVAVELELTDGRAVAQAAALLRRSAVVIRDDEPLVTVAG